MRLLRKARKERLTSTVKKQSLQHHRFRAGNFISFKKDVTIIEPRALKNKVRCKVLRCPFVYSNGKQCDGYISEIKIIKADILANLTEDNKLSDLDVNTDYHVHLYCSKKSNHAGSARRDSDQMKIWWNELPDEIKQQILGEQK